MDVTNSVAVFVSSLIATASYGPYVRDVLRGKTLPHSYSWLVWTLLQGTGAAAMVAAGAGWGAAFLAAGAALSGVIFLLSLSRGTHDITRFDAACLAGALCALGAYIFLDDPILSIIAVSITDLFAFAPTWRKTYAAPESETFFTYAANALAGALSFAALPAITFAIALYPASFTLTNAICAGIIVGRRKRDLL